MSNEFTKPYRLEFFQSDVGQIIHYVPVLEDGTLHPEAKDKWRGQANAMTPGGPINLQFELPGPTLTECIAAWSLELGKCAEQFKTEMRKRAIAAGAQAQINVKPS